MKVALGQMKIYYNNDGNVNAELDKDLELVLKKHGYRWDGSGMCMHDNDQESGIRDLIFRKEKIGDVIIDQAVELKRQNIKPKNIHIGNREYGALKNELGGAMSFFSSDPEQTKEMFYGLKIVRVLSENHLSVGI